MKKKINILIILTLIQFSIKSYTQENKDTLNTKDSQQKEDVEWESPFSFFATAGASYMFGSHYSVAVSPIDNTVQFEQTFLIPTRFSLGLVWNLIPEKEDNYVENFIKNKKLTKHIKWAVVFV